MTLTKYRKLRRKKNVGISKSVYKYEKYFFFV